jgi:disulfide bond formation protein DsbB
MLAAWGGAILVTVSAFRGGSLAFATAMHRLHPGAMGAAPSGSAWLAGAVLALVGAALLSTGLKRYPSCSPDHPFGWFVAGFAVFPASAILFFVLSAGLPFTA